MRRLALALLLIGATAFGQTTAINGWGAGSGTGGTVYQATAPSGSCSVSYLIYDTANTTLYGCAVTWQAITGGGGSMVYPGAGIANSTGTAWGTSYTTSGSGTVLALTTSPTFTTPALGTPSALVLTNATGLPNAGLVNTATTVNGTSCTLGSSCTATAAAGTLTGATLNSGVTASSLTSFGSSPTLVTPALGTPSALVLTNATSLPGGQITGATSIPASTLPLATAAAFGAVKCDGTSITCTAGVIAAAGSAPAFSAVTSGTNTAAAMLVGTGASLGVSGSGSITATAAPASGLTGATLASGVTASSLTSFGASPALVTPNLGTPSAINLTNATSFPATVVQTGQANTYTTGAQDFSALSVTAGLKAPSAAGAVPTADGFQAWNTTNHTHVWGSNGTTIVGAAAATGTGTNTSCTNQAVTTISGIAAPTCSTITSSFVDTSIAKTGTDINTSNQVTVTHLASALPVLQGGTGTTTSTGSGNAVLSTSPTLVTPALGTPSALVLTNATALPWSAHANPTGNLSLSMSGDTSTFTYSSALSAAMQWYNSTAAIVSASTSGPLLDLSCGNEWHAAASTKGCATVQFVPGTGTDAANTIAFTHTGSASGATTTTFPGPIQAGSSGGVGGGLTSPEGTAMTGVGSSDILYADSTAHRWKMLNNNGTADTMVGAATTDTLTNKSIDAAEVNSSTFAAARMPAFTGDVTTSAGAVANTLAAKYKTFSCQPGLGDGLNAIAAGTYLQSECFNLFGATYTITSVSCYTDNAGSSTLNITNGAGTALLTGAITCSSTFPGAAGTQSGTVTIATNDGVKFTFVGDGTSKQTTWVVTGTR